MDLEATIDLGTVVEVCEVVSAYLQNVEWGIFLPERVTYSGSVDGREFHRLAEVACDVAPETPGPLRREFSATCEPVGVRYLRVHARSIGTIPDWHRAKGKKAWLFVDEILVR